MSVVDGYSAAQVRAAEAPHLAAGEPLMLRAAAALAAVIRAELGSPGRPTGTVLLLVGPGDNGGDALFAGAALAADGVRVVAAPVDARRHAEGEAAARIAGVEFLTPGDVAAVARAAGASAIVVDGILGTGTSASPALRGTARAVVTAVIDAIDAGASPTSDAPVPTPDRPLVVAVDLPSGIQPDDGTVPDPTVLRADVTVTFGAVKAGTLLEPAAQYAGRLELVDLGLGPELSTMAPLVERA